MKSITRNSGTGSTLDALPFLVLCLFMFLPGTVQAQENLALGKPAVASSIEDNSNTDTIYYASYVSDGNPYTRWASYWNDNEWIYINLETSYEIQRIVLNWEVAYGKSYNIDVSFDGNNWKTAFEERNGDGEIDVIDFKTPVAAQYVRMTGLERGTVFGFSLWEFEIYKLTPTELYVDKNGVNLDNNCLDPENPCATITYAIGQANPGNSINIAAGIYTEWFIVDKSLNLQGAGKDSTIIQASSQQGEAISRVVTIPERLIVEISDMTIRHGYGTGSGSSGRGGGIGIENSKLTLENVDLRRNEATYGGGIHNNAGTLALTNVAFIENKANNQGQGGGMYNFNSSPELTDVIFRENMANSNGGGMSNSGGSSPTLTNVSFIGNSANSSGGGIRNTETSSPKLTGVKFSGNTARNGGGMYNNDSSPILSKVVFTDNEADTLGGGLTNMNNSDPSLSDVIFDQNSTPYLGGGMLNEHSSPTLVRTEFINNKAEKGGGMYNYYSEPNLLNVKFQDNQAGQGGGLTNFGSSPLLTNVIFTGNSAGSAGGLFNFNGSEAVLINVNFTGNVASEGSAGAIGNYVISSITMINCIVWSNKAKNGSGNEISNSATMELRHCIYKGEKDDILDEAQGIKVDSSSLSVDPLFVDAENGNLRLQEGSPAINAGDPETDLSFFTIDSSNNPIDLDGNPRIRDGRIDIGAYEFDIITSIPPKQITTIPETGLYQNYPNPFSKSTNIKFRITDNGVVMLKVYDLLGNEVATLVDEEKSAGDHEVHFDATGLRSGVYICSLATEYDTVQTKRMIIVH